MILKRNWVRKHVIAGAVYLALIFGILIAGIYYWQYSSTTLISQIWQASNLNCDETVPIKARNKYSGEVKEFPSSCKFPRGWERISASTQKNEALRTYRNEDYGFELMVPSDYREINYQYNGKVDYVSVYLADQSKANLFVYPKGSSDLLIPQADARDESFSTLAGKPVKIKRWDLPDGRILVRYIFTEKVNNWNTCADAEKPNANCNRIDLYASSKELQDKLTSVVSKLAFFSPVVSAKTSEAVYYYANNKLHIYNPSTGVQTDRDLPGLESYATMKKAPGNKIVYLNSDVVSVFDISNGSNQILFAKNTENGITYVPDNFTFSVDGRIAVGYRAGSDRDLNACNSRCSGVKAGILILDMATGNTTASFDVPVQATPVRWIGQNIILNHWTGSKFTTIYENGELNPLYPIPADLAQSNTTNAKLIRTDITKAVDIRNQQDRFGSASYLFVNGKVVYKGGLASINLVQK